jgi:hypothetical protein
VGCPAARAEPDPCQWQPCRQPSVSVISPALRAVNNGPSPPWSQDATRSPAPTTFRDGRPSPRPAPAGPCSLAALVRGPLPPPPRAARLPRASSPRRCAGGSARNAAAGRAGAGHRQAGPPETIPTSALPNGSKRGCSSNFYAYGNRISLDCNRSHCPSV